MDGDELNLTTNKRHLLSTRFMVQTLDWPIQSESPYGIRSVRGWTASINIEIVIIAVTPITVVVMVVVLGVLAAAALAKEAIH